MSELAPSGLRYRFADFELDLKNAMLRRDGRPIRLRPQSFKILALLVSRAGALVTREEVRGEIWSADTFVDFNQGLNACIKQIREALGDQAESPRFIETVPRLGYRFTARVEAAQAADGLEARAFPEAGAGEAQPSVRPRSDAPSAVSGASSQPRARLRLGVVLLLLGAVVAVGFGTWRFWPARAQPDRTSGAIRSIAVLPLINLAGDAERPYFADGMTEALINELARIRGLRVISRTSSMQYRDTRKPIQQIARELRVDAVIEGSVQQSGDRVRTTVQLIDGSTDQPLWASSYDRDLRDVLVLQRDVTDAIVREIRAEVPTAEGGQGRARRSIDPAAYEAYLKGRFFWNKRNKEGYEHAVEYFEEAIRLDPDYAHAYAGLADTLALYTNSEHLPRDEGYKRAKDAALKASSLDETLAEAHTSLGFILHKYEYDWAGAEREFVRAIELNPNYATAHHWRALNFRVLGRSEDEYAEMKEAFANDPLSFAINVDFGMALTRVGKCDEAFEQGKKTVQMHGPNQRSILGEILVFCGKYEDAIPWLEKVGDSNDSSSIGTTGFLGYAYARTGRDREARHALEVLKKKPQKSALLLIAEIHGGLGETDRAFDYLEQLYRSRDDRILHLKFHPMLDPLRSDPRFQSLLQRMNLAPPR